MRFTPWAAVVVLVVFSSTGCGQQLGGQPVAAAGALASSTSAPPSSAAPAPTTTSSPDPTSSTSTSTGEGHRNTPEFGTYHVTIAGSVSGNAFRRSGTVTVSPTISRVGTGNGVNELDICLQSGFPGGLPQVGAIWFGSNTGCFNGTGAAQLDLAVVTVDGPMVTVEPDEEIAATLGNSFTASDNFAGACLYAPTAGSATITIGANGEVSGHIDVMGQAGAFCGNSRYIADISR